MTDVPHEYGPSRVGHGEAQCKWCHGTNRENAIISPNHCEERAKAQSLRTSNSEMQPRPLADEQRRRVFAEHLRAAISALDMRNAYRGPMSPDRGILSDLMTYLTQPSDETTAPRTLSATERLHNICDALSEQADESPFTREEWERIDKQTVAVEGAARALLDKMDTVRSTPYLPPAWEKEYKALRALVGIIRQLPPKTGAEP